MTRPVLLAALAGLAFSVFTLAPASARGFDEPPSQRVSYADLNVDSEAGARVLLRRIRAAAENVCTLDTPLTSARAHRIARACVSDATRRAVTAIDRPALTAVYEGRRFTMYAGL